MDVDQIRQRVRAVRDAGTDNEVAHGLEDQLHQDVLRAIASGAPNPGELAHEALATLDLPYVRWYA